MDTTHEPALEAEATPLSEALGGEPLAQPQEQPAAPSAEPKPEPAPAATAEDAKAPFWYRKEIEKERKERQRLARELEQMRTRPPANDPPPVDFTNPGDVQSYIAQTLEMQALHGRLERSEERFTDKHGAQTFEECRDWLATRPDIEEWALKQRDPWAAAHQQYTRERLSAEIGDDPESWRTKERERLKAELLAEMGGQPAPAPQMRPPLPRPGATMPSASPRDSQGRFTGPTPIGDATRHKF